MKCGEFSAEPAQLRRHLDEVQAEVFWIQLLTKMLPWFGVHTRMTRRTYGECSKKYMLRKRSRLSADIFNLSSGVSLMFFQSLSPLLTAESFVTSPVDADLLDSDWRLATSRGNACDHQHHFEIQLHCFCVASTAQLVSPASTIGVPFGDTNRGMLARARFSTPTNYTSDTGLHGRDPRQGGRRHGYAGPGQRHCLKGCSRCNQSVHRARSGPGPSRHNEVTRHRLGKLADQIEFNLLHFLAG